MTINYNKCILVFLLLFSLSDLINSQQLGSIQTSVPWKAGHASAYIYPYVILYGGSQDPSANYGTTTLSGSNSLWVWDSRNGSWYNPTVQVQSGVEMLPQVYIKATNLPSQGQLLTWVGNTTSNSVLQKLDINSWSWSFPTTNFQASTAKVAGYSIVTVDNTIYTYGGLAVDNNGYPNTNAVQNTLSFLDASSFQVSTGSNGIGLTDHTTCYLKKLNSLITFGGSTTGSSTGVTDAVNIYNLSSNVWNVQGLSTLIAPAARRLHTANCLDDFMIVFGGGTSQPFDSDIWILNATSYPNMFWQRMSVANQTESPNPRMGHSSVLDSENNKLYIFGGWGVTGTNDSSMYVLDISHWSWTKVPTTGYAKNQVTSPSIPPLNTTVTTGTSENHQNKAGIIAGATVGGVVFLALLVLALFFFKRRSRKEQEKDVTSSTHEDEQYVDKTSLPSDNYGRPPYRMSKAWSSTSFAKHSEIGDYSDRVVTGVLEAVTDAGTVAATHGSSRDSFRHSKTLLEIGPGQVPNEIISQKPNEFSVLIRPKHDLQVDHHRAALDDEDWTLPDSPLSPVQYIQTSSKPSIGTNSTWDTTEARRKAVTHHHPSSSIITNTPVAQTVHIPQEEEQSRPELYNRMSPLDLLASLGQHHHTESSGQSNSSGESFTILKSPSTSSSISDGLLTPIISLLPKRYQIDPTLPPIIGPSNSILFANDNNTKRPVTIKLFGRREAWERECRALTKLKSPWVVELVEVLTLQKKENEEEVKYVIVMERLSETLNRKKNIMPQEVASHLLRALAYCHNYRIAFCDLKPSNVMYVDGTWKLIDFEASRTIEEECVGVMTPRYCAPEVARATTYGLEGASGVVATASVDLWSLGCLIYELETQKSLFPNNIKDETILHFTSHPSPSTPILSNGLRWNEQQELEIPQLDKLIQNEHTRHIIKTLLSRDPLYRGSAQQWMQDTYFNY